MTFMTVLLPGDVRKQREVAGALDAAGELALVRRAVARDAGRQDLARVGREGAQDLDLLEVDVADLLGAEAADLAAHRIRGAGAPPPPPPARPRRPPRRRAPRRAGPRPPGSPKKWRRAPRLDFDAGALIAFLVLEIVAAKA